MRDRFYQEAGREARREGWHAWHGIACHRITQVHIAPSWNTALRLQTIYDLHCVFLVNVCGAAAQGNRSKSAWLSSHSLHTTPICVPVRKHLFLSPVWSVFGATSSIRKGEAMTPVEPVHTGCKSQLGCDMAKSTLLHADNFLVHTPNLLVHGPSQRPGGGGGGTHPFRQQIWRAAPVHHPTAPRFAPHIQPSARHHCKLFVYGMQTISTIGRPCLFVADNAYGPQVTCLSCHRT